MGSARDWASGCWLAMAATLISAGATGLDGLGAEQERRRREFFESLGAERLYEQTFTWDDGSELDEIGFVWRKLHS
jgi:hypothetical protein